MYILTRTNGLGSIVTCVLLNVNQRKDIMINLKQFFCLHTTVPTSRKLISIYNEIDHDYDVSTVNVYLKKEYCVKCKKRFATIVEIHERFYIKQPYDKRN